MKRAKSPRAGKRFGLGLLVVSSGWLLASGFRTQGDFTRRDVTAPAESHVKRDLRLLIRSVPDSDSTNSESTGASQPAIVPEPSDENPGVIDGTRMPDLRRDSPIPLRSFTNQGAANRTNED